METFDLRSMECFVVVVEEGAITRAAARLSVAPSTVSRRVEALERELGTRLVVRHGRAGVELSAEGRAVLREMTAVLHHLDWLRHMLSDPSH